MSMCLLSEGDEIGVGEGGGSAGYMPPQAEMELYGLTAKVLILLGGCLEMWIFHNFL